MNTDELRKQYDELSLRAIDIWNFLFWEAGLTKDEADQNENYLAAEQAADETHKAWSDAIEQEITVA